MRARNVLIKGFYWPLCRAYARLRGDRPADAVLRFLTGIQFWYIYRFWPNFSHPTRFSEKIWSRQLHNRDPRLTILSDKLRVRDYIAAKVGAEHLVPLLWSGRAPEEIPFARLPRRFVIKANHGCGFVIAVTDAASLDQATVRRQLARWLRTNYATDTFLGIAWGYKHVAPAIMVEELLEDNGAAPIDYKFWCFEGRVEFVSLHFDRSANHTTLSLDRSLAPGGLHFDLPRYPGHFTPPQNFDDMLRLAEALARDFEFMRVDCYNLRGRIYVGEMTPYPGGVTSKFEPESVDRQLGAKWGARDRSSAGLDRSAGEGHASPSFPN